MINKRILGSKYEEQACKYLEEAGYIILERNYHAGKTGEIDIIAKDVDSTIVFIECKYRGNCSKGYGLEAVDYRKIKSICKVASVFISKNKFSLNYKYRFDVISFDGLEDNIKYNKNECSDNKMTHIRNAFDFVNPYEY